MSNVGETCSVTTNPDMLGFCIRIASVVTNVCLAILIAWSPDDVQTAVQALLLQVYPVLITTFLTIHQNQLAITDARFAINITNSPLSIYLVHSAIRDVCGRPNDLFRRLGSTRVIIRILSLLLFVLWLTLDGIVSYAGYLFSGPSCQNIAHPIWLRFLLNDWFFSHAKSVSFHRSILVATFMCVVAAICWIMYLIRHFQDVTEEFVRRRRRAGWTRNPLRLAFHAIRSVWVIVTEAHPWIIFDMVLAAFYSWIWYLFSSLPEPGLTPSFGQLLSLFVTVQPVFSVVWLTCQRRQEMLPYLKTLPHSFWCGFVFIITGRSRPQPEFAVLPLAAPNQRVSLTSTPDVASVEIRPLSSNGGSTHSMSTIPKAAPDQNVEGSSVPNLQSGPISTTDTPTSSSDRLPGHVLDHQGSDTEQISHHPLTSFISLEQHSQEEMPTQ